MTIRLFWQSQRQLREIRELNEIGKLRVDPTIEGRYHPSDNFGEHPKIGGRPTIEISKDRYNYRCGGFDMFDEPGRYKSHRLRIMFSSHDGIKYSSDFGEIVRRLLSNI